MGAFVGADRYRAVDVCQRLVGVGGERLLDQLDIGGLGGGKERQQLIRRPGLVGVGDEARIGARGAHGGHALGVAFAAQLQFEQFQVRHRFGVLRHLRRIAEAERVAGHGGERRGDAGKFPGALACPLGVEIPQGAVERIARRTGG